MPAVCGQLGEGDSRLIPEDAFDGAWVADNEM